MIIFQTVFLSLFLLLLELLSGNFLISAGIPVYGAVYIYTACGKKYGIISALCCGMIIDAVYFRAYPVTPLIYLLILLLAGVVVNRYFRRRLPEAPVIGGACIGGLLFFGNIITAKLYKTQYMWPDPLSMLISQLAFGAVFMFLFTVLLDGLASRCKMAKFGAEIKNPGKTRGVRK